MDPPPRPSTDRFRIRVAVFAPEDAHNLQATPKHTFVIAKNQNFQLQDIPLRELRDVAIRRYKDIYPHESLFQITKSTDAYGSDLFLNDRVGDIFADNEVLRVIKGASIRDSLPPDYVNERSGSVQPTNLLQRKRSPATSNLGDLARAGKRQKVYKPDEPLPTCESDLANSNEDNILPQNLTVEEVIPNSQGTEVEYSNGRIEPDYHPQQNRPSLNRPSPVLGEGGDEELVVSDWQEKKAQNSEQATSKSGKTTLTRQTHRVPQNGTESIGDLQGIVKATPKSRNSTASRPSNKKRERSEDISEFEEHTTTTPLRGIPDPYSDIETDLEQPSSAISRRVTPLRQSSKPSPASAKSRLLQYGKIAGRSKSGSSSNNTTPKLNEPASAGTRSERKANGDSIQSVEDHRSSNALTDNNDDRSDGGLDAGAEQAAMELSKLTAKAAERQRVAELKQESLRRVESEKKAADAIKEELARIERDAANKKRANDAAAAVAARKKIEAAKRAASAALKQEEEQLAAEKKAKKEADVRNKAAEAEAKHQREKTLAEEAKRQLAEAAKREKEAKDKEDAEITSSRKKSTPTRSLGGMLGRTVATFKSETASVSHGVTELDMPPPASVSGRSSTSPALTRKGSEDIKVTRSILPRQGSSDIKSTSPSTPLSGTRRVSFAESAPPVVGKTPSKATQSPLPIQTPRTVNGIHNSSSSLRQSKIVPRGVGEKSGKGKIITPSGSQMPTSGQQIKPTQTPKSRANISAALLNTINKGNSSTVKEKINSKSSAIPISSDEDSDNESVGELELPPLPPSSIRPMPQNQALVPADVNIDDTPSNASPSASESTDQSERESRSPVQFVNSSLHSRAASSTQSFDGSNRSQQFRPNGSETSEKSTSGDSASGSEASSSDVSASRSKQSATDLPSKSAASRRIIPPSSRVSHLREGSTTPKPPSRGRKKMSSGSEGETSMQKLLDSQLTNETASSSAAKDSTPMNTLSPSLSSSQARNRLSTTPIPVPKSKFTNGNCSGKGTPQTSERPAIMAHYSSLRQRTSEALEMSSKRLEEMRRKGEAAAKALKDTEVIQLDGAPSEEESEPESSSSSDSESDTGSESSEKDGSSNDVEMGGVGTPTSASKAKAKAQKPSMAFSKLSKRFTLSQQGSRR